MIFVRRRIGIKGDVRAYTSAQSGVTYTNGINGLSAEELNEVAKAISNNNAITNSVGEVWISYYNRHISVGDQISYTMNSENYPFRIMGFNHYALTSSSFYGTTTATGNAGILLQMVNVFSEKRVMNSTETSGTGWDSSELRTWLNGTMLDYLPSETKSYIAQVNIKTAKSVSSSSIITTAEKMFLPAEVEIYGSTEYAIGGASEGTWYQWYKTNNTDESRIKYLDGDVSMWWERSPAAWRDSGSLAGATFGCVGSAGRKNAVWARYSRGISPCFCY